MRLVIICICFTLLGACTPFVCCDQAGSQFSLYIVDQNGVNLLESGDLTLEDFTLYEEEDGVYVKLDQGNDEEGMPLDIVEEGTIFLSVIPALTKVGMPLEDLVLKSRLAIEDSTYGYTAYFAAQDLILLDSVRFENGMLLGLGDSDTLVHFR